MYNINGFREGILTLPNGKKFPISIDCYYVNNEGIPEIRVSVIPGIRGKIMIDDFKRREQTRYSRPFALQDIKPTIEKVIFNPPATIVLWNDGTKTVVKCHVKDRYSKEIGLAMCISKKLLDNRDDFYEEFKKWISDEPIDACQSFESIGAIFGRACEAFRVGFLKGVEEFNKTLKAKETEDIPVEEMREKLVAFCHKNTFCSGCSLHKNFECGRGKFFDCPSSDKSGYMTDDEIRDAYNRVFGKKKED